MRGDKSLLDLSADVAELPDKTLFVRGRVGVFWHGLLSVELEAEVTVNAEEATDWPFLSRNLKLPEHQVALATLQAGSSKLRPELELLVLELELEWPVETELKDSMSMSTQVAVTVEVVPNILRPLSSFPLGSYKVLGSLVKGLSGVRTTLGGVAKLLLNTLVLALLLLAKLIPNGKIL